MNRAQHPIYQALAHGPKTAKALAKACQAASSGRIAGTLTWMVHGGRIIRIGSVDQARAAGIDPGPARYGRSTVYALPGTPQLAPVDGATHARGRSSGSGVIAGPIEIPGYRW